MDGIVLPGEQETLEAEQGAEGEDGFRGGGAGDEGAVSVCPLRILKEPPRDPREEEDETELDKAVQARRRERMHENTPKKGTVRKGAGIPVDLAGRFVNSRNVRLEGEFEVSRGNIPKDFFFFIIR